MEISLSILKIDYAKIGEALDELKPELQYVHLDIMDGHFVPNISFGADLVKSIHKDSSLFFDTHLMIDHPKQYIKSFVDAGSDAITFHLEAVDHPIELIDYIHSFGVKAGISIKPATDVTALKPYLKYVDLILIMSVEPGFGGQRFMPEAIEKVKYLKEEKDKHQYSYWISIDGGIQDQTLPLVASYLDLAVVGSYITSAKNSLEKLKELKHICR